MGHWSRLGQHVCYQLLGAALTAPIWVPASGVALLLQQPEAAGAILQTSSQVGMAAVCLPAKVADAAGRAAGSAAGQVADAAGQMQEAVAEHTNKHRNPLRFAADAGRNMLEGRFPLRHRDALYYFNKAQREIFLGNEQKALAFLEEACRFEPPIMVSILRVQLLLRLERFGEAAAALEQVMTDLMGSAHPLVLALRELHASPEEQQEAKCQQVLDLIPKLTSAGNSPIYCAVCRANQTDQCCCLQEEALIIVPCGTLICPARFSELEGQPCPACIDRSHVVDRGVGLASVAQGVQGESILMQPGDVQYFGREVSVADGTGSDEEWEIVD